jgi:hypothetical protein
MTEHTFKDYETSQQVADRLEVDASQVRRYCEHERFPGAVKIANRWFIPKGAMPEARNFGRPQSFARDQATDA